MALLDGFDWLESCDGVIEVSLVGESPGLISVELVSAEQRELLEFRLKVLQRRYRSQGPTRLLVMSDES
jgi:hypothetical protein